MYHYLEEELQQLTNKILKMGSLVEGQLSLAVKALFESNMEYAQQVIERDDKVDKYDIKIDKLCQRIFALTQPVAVDLRIILSALKTNNDLERMGDHVASIAKATISLKGEERIHVVEEDISLLGEKVKSIVDASLNAYIQGNDKRAHEIAEQQYVIKSMSHEIQEKILDGMKENSETVTTGKEYLLTLVYLERITGYAVNLCEWIVYLNSGNIIEL